MALGGGRGFFCSVKVSAGAPAARTCNRPDSVSKPGALATRVQKPERRPIIAKRPLSSVVAVRRKSAFQSSRGRNESERKHAGRQRHVRDEDREIDGPHYSLPREAYRSDLGVIDDVADEEERGGRERRKHARTMLGDAPRADQGVSRGEKYRRERVEARVDGGEVVDSHGWQRTTLSWQGRRWPTVIPCCKSSRSR